MYGGKTGEKKVAKNKQKKRIFRLFNQRRTYTEKQTQNIYFKMNKVISTLHKRHTNEHLTQCTGTHTRAYSCNCYPATCILLWYCSLHCKRVHKRFPLCLFILCSRTFHFDLWPLICMAFSRALSFAPFYSLCRTRSSWKSNQNWALSLHNRL